MSNFAIYMIGMIIVIGGLAYGADRVGVGQTWILIGAAVLLGVGVMGGVAKTRQKEAPPPS